MDENKTYSAEDMLRYAHGQMPVAERYALEKAALEDVFLAEALDGYVELVNGSTGKKSLAEVSENLPPQLNELRKIIAEKAADETEEKKAPVISILRNRFLQSAVAAMLIFGVAWWFYSISNKSKEGAIVSHNKQIAQVQPPAIMDSVAPAAKPKEIQISKSTVVDNLPRQEQPTISANKSIQSDKAAAEVVRNDDVAHYEKPAPENSPATSADSVIIPSKDMALNEVNSSSSNAYKKESYNKSVVVGYGTQRKDDLELKKMTIAKKPSYIFQGRVLDANRNPLPFSSVMVPGEDFGTYSNGEGYFNFVYTDSILPVRAKSLGFEAQNYNMRANEKENVIMLNEDKNLDKSLTFLRSEKQKRRADFKPNIIKVDSISSTVEPFVGWRNYDLYLANNNRLSDLQLYSNRSVLLSFDVSEDGGIKNITVDKSQGKDLDAEAIRLLKEGPKWKIKKDGKKGKVEVKF